MVNGAVSPITKGVSTTDSAQTRSVGKGMSSTSSSDAREDTNTELPPSKASMKPPLKSQKRTKGWKKLQLAIFGLRKLTPHQSEKESKVAEPTTTCKRLNYAMFEALESPHVSQSALVAECDKQTAQIDEASLDSTVINDDDNSHEGSAAQLMFSGGDIPSVKVVYVAIP